MGLEPSGKGFPISGDAHTEEYGQFRKYQTGTLHRQAGRPDEVIHQSSLLSGSDDSDDAIPIVEVILRTGAITQNDRPDVQIAFRIKT